MSRKKLLGKLTASALAVCMLGSAVLPNAGYLKVQAAENEDAEWNEVQEIVSGIYGEYNDFVNAKGQNWPDGSKLGNGQEGIVVDGSGTEQNFYINSNDFWDGWNKLSVGGVRMTSVDPGRGAGDETAQNIALGAACTACCAMNNNYVKRVTDGDVTSVQDGYVSKAYNPDNSSSMFCDHYEHWVMVDLKEVKTFGMYKLYHDGAVRGQENEKFNTADFRIQIWNGEGTPNGSEPEGEQSWKTIDTVTDNTENITYRELDTEYSAQYVRIYIDRCEQSEKGTLSTRARIQEFELYSNEPAVVEDPTVNICGNTGVTATASTEYTTWGHAAKRAIDGNLDEGKEGWVSNPGGPHWLLVDLTQKYQIGCYKLYHDGAVRGTENEINNLSDFVIQAWNGEQAPDGSEPVDDENWKTIDEVTGNTENITQHDLDQKISTQYVRVYITKPEQNNANGRARIQEFELYSGTIEESVPVGEESFHAKQDILNAQVDVEQTLSGVPYETKSFITKDGILLTEVEMLGTEPDMLYIDLWNYGSSKNCTSEAGVTNSGNIYMARQTAGDESGNKHLARVGVVSKVFAADGSELQLQTDQVSAQESYAGVELQPNQKIIIATAIASDYGFAYAVSPMQDYIAQAEEKLSDLNSADAVEAQREAHRQDWKEYWMKSYVQLNDPDLMKYYYGALYAMKCNIREDSNAPSIFGNWATTDEQTWGGYYFLNYNFQSTYWGVLSSNRPELFKSYNDQIIGDYYYRGQKQAANAGYDGTMVRRSGQPYGSNIAGWEEYMENWQPTAIAETKDRDKLGNNQLSLNAFLANDVAKYYYYTMDEEFLPYAYQMVKVNADFYLDYLEKEELEDGNYRYIVKDSAARETSEGAINSTLDLTYCKAMLQYAIDMSQRLGQDEDMIPVWEEYLTHLSELPTTIDSVDPGTGLEVLQEEESYPDGKFSLSGQGDNVDNCNAIFPGMLINRASDPKWVEIAQNTVKVMQSWRQNNSFVKVFSVAAYCGYDTDDLYAQFKSVVQEKLRSDLMINDNQHGIEKIGALESVNAMLLQEGGGNIYLFPAWPSDKDAEFTRLRAKGAFLVSAEYSGTDQEVKNVTITSEAGEDMTLVVPWEEGATVKDSQGNIVDVTKGAVENWPDDKTITFATKAGETYTVEKGETEPEKPSKETLKYFLDLAKEHKANGDVDNCAESVKKLFDEAITEGDAVMADEDATYDEIKNAAEKLMYAIHALNMTVDKTTLEMAVDIADDIVLENYVEEGKAEFQKALKDAQDVLADENALQKQVDDAWNALVDAMSELRLKADKSVLEDLLNKVEGLDLSQYTEESVAVFNAALAKAQAVMADEDLSEDDQKTVDDAVQALKDAKDQLKLKDGSGEDGNGDGNTGDGQTPGSGDNSGNGGNSGSDNGNSNGKADAPKTGDAAVPFGMLALAVIAGGVIVVSFRKKSR